MFAFLQLHQKGKKQELYDLSIIARVAYHAEAKDFKKLAEELGQEE